MDDHVIDFFSVRLQGTKHMSLVPNSNGELQQQQEQESLNLHILALLCLFHTRLSVKPSP